MRALIRMVAVPVAVLAAAPAFAETYKWVNENGVTNYSNSPPPNAAAARKLETVPDRISVIPQDRTLMRAAADALRSNERIFELERELAAARGAGRYPAAAGGAQAAYQRCIADRRVDCDMLQGGGYDGGGYGYYPAAPYYVIGTAFRPGVFVSRVSARGSVHARRGAMGHSR